MEKLCQCICYQVSGAQPSWKSYNVTFNKCSCECSIHLICLDRCEIPMIQKHDTYSHTIICKKQDSMNKSRDLGFFGLAPHYGIELEYELKSDSISFHKFLDIFSHNELSKYFIVTPEPSVSNGIEFVSAPMSYYYCSKILPKFYDFLKNQENCQFLCNENTGLHIHLTKELVNQNNLESYIFSNNKEIDLFAGRKENKFCKRVVTNDKNSAIRSTEYTIEVRIFSMLSVYELLNKIKILSRVVL